MNSTFEKATNHSFAFATTFHGIPVDKMTSAEELKNLLLCCGVIYWVLQLLLYVVNQLHFYFTAEKPQIHCQKTGRNQLILRKCAMLTKEKFYPTWYLFNGHMQTIMLALSNNTSKYEVDYKREMFHLSDGGVVSLDWAYPSLIKTNSDTPTAIILHGLTGGSQELYIRTTVKELLNSGWRIVVMNARGCSKTPVWTPKTFCAAHTSDLREVVSYLREFHVSNDIPLIGIGYSLGSNILVKYVGEEKDRCVLTAAVSIGNPFDVEECCKNLSRSLFNRLVYRSALANNLTSYFHKDSNAHEQFYDHSAVNVEEVIKSKSVREFDETYTIKVFGYETSLEYYRAASSDLYILDVEIPLLCLNAMDDPISFRGSIPFDEINHNPNCILATTDRGGHLGYFQGNGKKTKMWSSLVIRDYFNTIHSLVEQKIIPVIGFIDAKQRKGIEKLQPKTDCLRIQTLPVPVEELEGKNETKVTESTDTGCTNKSYCQNEAVTDCVGEPPLEEQLEEEYKLDYFAATCIAGAILLSGYIWRKKHVLIKS